MKQGTILHLFGWDKKFMPPFRDFIHKHFADGRHRFIVYGAVPPGELTPSSDTVIYPSLLKNSFAVSRAMHKAEKIILHGLFSSHLFYILAFQPWLLKKCCWVIWGGDLYVRDTREKDWRWVKNEFFRKIVFSNISLITTTVPGDYKLVKKWYKTKARFVQNLMYYSHLARQISSERISKEKSVVIQIGNSGDSSNNHKELIDKLSNCKNTNFIVYAPLSYGDEKHISEVKSYGFNKLGTFFVPITEFMPFLKYTEYLRSIDVAIFNHRRQQGMGNLIGLIGLGKKVYIRSDVTPWEYFNELGITIYDTKGELSLVPLNDSISKRNKDIARKEFSEEKLISSWNAIFNCPFYEIGRAS